MAVSVTHSTVATLPDEVGAEVNKAEWNAAHTITGLATVAGTGVYSDLIGTPTLATIATTGSGADLTAASVTYAKIQNVSATDKVLGRATALAGVVEEIACTAAGRALIDDADAAAQRTTLGLGNVDNTSDAAKPVSTTQQNALDLKANLAGPTFTGTVGGITATMVGLGNVTNNAQTQAAVVPNTAPAAGKILVGNAGGTAYAPVAMGTDATLSSAGALTIAAAAVTLAKMENRATQTFIGRNTAATGVPEELSVATAKTMLGLTGTNSGDQTITLTGNVTGAGTGSFATTIAAGVVTRAMLATDGKNWTFLGQGTASTAVRTGVVTWAGTFKQLLIEYFIAGYSGSAIGRVLVGPTAGISETGTTFSTQQLTSIATTNTGGALVSLPGWPTAQGTAAAVARFGWMRVQNVAGSAKRMEGEGQYAGTAATTAPSGIVLWGNFNDTTNLINKVELAVYTDNTTTTVSATTFNPGTYVNVFGRNDD